MNRFVLKDLTKALVAIVRTAAQGRDAERHWVPGRASRIPMGLAFTAAVVLASVVWSQTAVGAMAPETGGDETSPLRNEIVTPYLGLDGSLMDGPKQAFCNHVGCPDETYHHCFSGTVTIKTPIGEVSGSVTCYEPNHGGPGLIPE